MCQKWFKCTKGFRVQDASLSEIYLRDLLVEEQKKVEIEVDVKKIIKVQLASRCPGALASARAHSNPP